MDLPGEKLLIKLWETLAERGIGSLLKPWQMRREGHVSIDLKRRELLAVAQAEADAMLIKSGRARLLPDGNLHLVESTDVGSVALDPQVADVISALVLADAQRREVNTAQAVLAAVETLQDDPQIPPASNINQDWLYRWRDYAGEVSNTELQDVWGRLLAGELKSPGSFSLRTMDFIRNLSQSEAQKIMTLSQFVVGQFVFRDAEDLLRNAGVDLNFLLAMQQLGIIAGVESLGLEVTLTSGEQTRFVLALTSNSMALIVTGDDPSLRLKLPCYTLTSIGREVLTLANVAPNIDYLELVGKHMLNQSVNVQLAEYTNVSEDKIRYYNTRNLTL